MKVRPRGTGMILRLVDVVLILLFGFLMIAKIQLMVDITLPHSQGDNNPPEDDSTTFDVFVYSNGMITAGRAQTLLVTMPLRDRHLAEARIAYETLKGHLQQLNRGRRTVVIRSEYQAPVQFTVDLLDICNELDMPKSIRCFEATAPPARSGG